MGLQNILKSKKAGLPDGFFLIVAFFAIAILFILMYVILSNFNDKIQELSAVHQVGKDLSSDLLGKYVPLFNQMFLFIVIGLGIAVLAGAWFIASHPALFWISVPILAFIIFVGAVFANIYAEITDNQEISAYADEFTFINFIFEHFVMIIMVFVLLLALVLFGKGRLQQTI